MNKNCRKKYQVNIVAFLVAFLILFAMKSFAQKAELMIQTGHQSTVVYMGISPDETKMFSVDRDLTGILWDLTTAKQLHVFRNVKAGEFNADSKSLLIAYNDKSFKTIDLTGNVIKSYSATTSFDWISAAKAKLYIALGLLVTSETLFKIYQRKAVNIKYYDSPDCWEYAPAKGQVVVSGSSKNEVAVLDTITGALIKKIPLPFEEGEGVNHISFSKDNNTFLAAGSLYKGSVSLVDFNSAQVLKTFTYINLLNAVLAPDAQTLIVVTQDKIAQINAANGDEIWSRENTKGYQGINFFGSGNEIVLSSSDGKSFGILNTKTGTTQQRIGSTVSSTINSIQLLADQKTLTAQSRNQLIYWSLSSGKMDSVTASAAVEEKGVFAHTKNELVSKENSSSATLDFYEMPSHKLMYQIADPKIASLSRYFFSSTDKYIALPDANGATLFEIETKKKITLSKTGLSTSYSKTETFTPDDQYYVTGQSNGIINFYNIAQQTLEPDKNLAAHNAGVVSITFSNDGKLMFTSGEDNSIKIWDYKTRSLMATLYSFPATNDWAVLTPDGHFDATPGAQKNMYYVKGIQTISLADMFEKFYTPQLLLRILNGEKINKEDVAVDSLHPKPTVAIQYEEKTRTRSIDDNKPLYNNTTGVADITVTASADNDKISEIRLFQNGKVVNLATRGLFVTDDAAGTDSKKYSIPLLPGKNVFSAVALNTQRTESQPDVIEVMYNNTGSSMVSKNEDETITIDKIDKSATLHLVVVGINAYQNPKMSLNYALADATAFKEEVEKDAKTLITNTQTYFVTDAEANKAGIVKALQQVQQNAKPQDVFIFYYAGHGVIAEGNKEFYLVPNDVADLNHVDQALKEHGIAAKDLQQYAINIQAQKQLFILDACQSAGAFADMLSSDGNQQKNIALVARSTGTHWMAASGAQQYANEFSTLGHGAFTYVLLQALKGEAASNKMITVDGLKTYMQNGVPALMKKYNGSQQTPASYGFGDDFPVEVVK